MLGEFPSVSRIDLQGSKGFLAKVRRGFLSHVCEKVDAVEPIAKFTKVLQDSAVAKTGAVGTVYTKGLEDWYPEKKYDLIWTQWCGPSHGLAAH
ncbi:hypothetical protein PENARI_c001G12476 [Penicillium arizonense]|uniref:Alpha N-terminal protein methyltransferase 1 n=1 Tax=Penicillium arizonense TaxID=1835702 RepID=A0A1F5LZA7_PENAI|nr:hypothetical protein PENARI_c001G12476 [Penicillium arizonense]OGE58464.1 hypothetical protein PENARI_c001G12476 [Penicillium arizonense]